MILMPDLFSFAYVPNWYSQLAMLAEMALPEPWRFKNPIYLTKNPDTPILERYIHAIFKKQLIDYKDEKNPKGLVIKVTDPRLLDRTGGIVQGMSGSPLIQNGKLAGAVTHVFVSDPTRGYGILMETMLAETEN